jgi:tetratricopeptide (TPR) repeat protein
MEHWTARIRRKQGWLELFEGHPGIALRELETSLEHFRRTRDRYELAQVCYGIGWAHSLRGNVEAAISWNRQGLDYAMEHNNLSGRADDRSLLQGHLYLGGDHLDTGDLETARPHLEEASRIAEDPRLGDYHEVGRVQLLLGRLETRERNWEKARGHLQWALEFFSNREEQVLLATAHNALGDHYLDSGSGQQLHRAADHYQKALAAARNSRPPSQYYECAALVNLCRARVRGGAESVEFQTRAGVPPSESDWGIDRLMALAQEIGGVRNRYRNHLARLAVIEAELAIRREDRPGAAQAAGRALHLGHNFSPLLLGEVRDRLRRLDLPEELLDAPVARDDGT